jgi:hypothetical protein
MYEKFTTFLRLEALSNNLKDFGLKKSLDNLEAVREKLAAATDRFAAFEAEALNVHVDFPLFQRLAPLILSGNSRVPGIKIHNTRMIRLMEVLLHSGTKLGGWRIAAIHQAILTAFGLKAEDYTLTQLRYDLRKMRAHGPVERDGKRYSYRPSAKGNKVALMFVLFHKRVFGLPANSLFNAPPHPESKTGYQNRDGLPAGRPFHSADFPTPGRLTFFIQPSVLAYCAAHRETARVRRYAIAIPIEFIFQGFDFCL